MQHLDIKETAFSKGLCKYIMHFKEQSKPGSHQFLLQREGLLGSFQCLRSKSVIRKFSEDDTLFCSIPSSLPEHIRIAMKRMFIRSEFLQAVAINGKKTYDFEHFLDGVREEAPLYTSRVTYRLLDYNSNEMSFLGRFGDGKSRGCERLIKFHDLLEREIQVVKIFAEEFDKEVTVLIPFCRSVKEVDLVRRAIREAIPSVSIGLMVETFICLENLSDYIPISCAFFGASDLLAEHECIARTDIDYSQPHELSEMSERVKMALINQLPKIYKLGHLMEICTCKDLNNLKVDLPCSSISRTFMPDQLVLSDGKYLQQFRTKALG